MKDFFDISNLGLAAGSALLGALSSVVGGFFAARLLKKSSSGPLVIKRKGTSETAVIPAHYDSEAVDLLLKQLRSSHNVAA